MECDPDHCRLNCDYGFVSSGKKYFPADEDIEEKCVSIAAMLVGKANINILINKSSKFSDPPGPDQLSVFAHFIFVIGGNVRTEGHHV